jgi:peroxiredoxin
MYYEAFQEAGAEIIAVAVTSIEVANSWCHGTGATYPVLADPDHRASEAYGVYNLLGDGYAAPAVFVIEPDRRVAWRYVGQNRSDRPSLQSVLDRLP